MSSRGVPFAELLRQRMPDESTWSKNVCEGIGFQLISIVMLLQSSRRKSTDVERSCCADDQGTWVAGIVRLCVIGDKLGCDASAHKMGIV